MRVLPAPMVLSHPSTPPTGWEPLLGPIVDDWRPGSQSARPEQMLDGPREALDVRSAKSRPPQPP
ncbi:MAG: hypothetical protein V9E98_01215 [Candidatus Nanopelagicales bacterium]